MKNKPGAKEGVKVFLGADLENSYGFFFQIYFPGK